MTIPEIQIKARDSEAPFTEHFVGSVDQLIRKTTKSDKPFYVMGMRDALGSINLQLWQDDPNFHGVETGKIAVGQVFRVDAKFSVHASYGLQAADPRISDVSKEEREAFLRGGEEVFERQQKAYKRMLSLLAEVAHPRLQQVATAFLTRHGREFRRAGAARSVHQPYRGGLLEHTFNIMAALDALCSVYKQANRDVLMVGALFHDSGKIFENQFQEDSFAMPFSAEGELLGHITLGITLFEDAVRELPDSAEEDLEFQRLCLQVKHLIVSHHGQKEWGSPVEPRSLEAMMMHCMDLLDSRSGHLEKCLIEGARLSDELVQGVSPRRDPIWNPKPKA